MKPPASRPDAAPRFEFGKNWQAFLGVLDERRIAEAEESLRSWLRRDHLRGLRFLDAGSGSGLFSLAARRLGAVVCSFDLDPESVSCTAELKGQCAADDPEWYVDRGSVLDRSYLATLGTFDVVYSWGVLHHTGSLWEALDNVALLVRDGGQLCVAIYNDQGWLSRYWWHVKRTYHLLPRALRTPYLILIGFSREVAVAGGHVLQMRPGRYLRSRLGYRRQRGMSWWHDLIDWIAGFPFEVAKPEEVFEFLEGRGFRLTRMKTCGGRLGCNEFTFQKDLSR